MSHLMTIATFILEHPDPGFGPDPEGSKSAIFGTFWTLFSDPNCLIFKGKGSFLMQSKNELFSDPQKVVDSHEIRCFRHPRQSRFWSFLGHF